MAADIAKVTQSLTTAARMRETTQMLMQRRANWETFLTPAPLFIAILAELVFISSVTDFSINKNPPAGGFKYIKYPDSFRACLMQVCNSGWQAFNTAHKNMNEIRIYTATVPDDMKAAVKLLFTRNDEVVKGLLPIQLKTLSNTARECVIRSQNVEQKFFDVIELIQELLEACVNAGHFYGDELEKIESEIEQNKIREEAARERKGMSMKLMEDMSKQLKDANEAYKKAVGSIPSGWEMIGLSYLAAPSEILYTFTNGITSIFGRKKNIHKPQNSTVLLSKITACTYSRRIKELVASLREFINGKEIRWDRLYDQKEKRLKTTWTKDRFHEIFQNLNLTSHSTLQESASKLVKDGLVICKELDSYAPDQEWNKNQTDDMIGKTRALYNEVFKFDSRCSKMFGSPSLTPKPPMMYRTESSLDVTAGQKEMDNAQYKVVQSAEQLRGLRGLFNKTVVDIKESHKELTDILVEMQNISLRQVKLKTMLKMLGKGMQAMSRVKEQWEKMVQFFQMMSNIMKTSLDFSIDSFVKGAKKTMSFPYDAKLFAKDMIYNQAFEASNIASLVHMISGTYCEVSRKYLMDKVSRLGTIMVMNKTSNAFLVERMTLQESCKEAQEGILQLVQKKKQEYESKLDSRLAEIEGDLKAVLPAASPQETKMIEGIVHAGYVEADSDPDSDYI